MTAQTKLPPLRLLVYDNTCRGKRFGVGLTHSWWLGASFYTHLKRFDAVCAAHDWAEALAFLTTFEAHRAIGEIQFWGHGKWGEARIAQQILDISALEPDHVFFPALRTLAARMDAPSARFWFRTCETFGGAKGHAFAAAFSQFLGCQVAGHTYIIGPWQSGLHNLSPNEEPYWPEDEGIKEGTAHAPRKAFWSNPRRPHTITCFHHRFPERHGNNRRNVQSAPTKA